jgi:hypothetical protein
MTKERQRRGMPEKLADWVAEQGPTSDVIVRALITLKDGATGPGPDQRPVVLQGMVE